MSTHSLFLCVMSRTWRSTTPSSSLPPSSHSHGSLKRERTSTASRCLTVFISFIRHQHLIAGVGSYEIGFIFPRLSYIFFPNYYYYNFFIPILYRNFFPKFRYYPLHFFQIPFFFCLHFSKFRFFLFTFFQIPFFFFHYIFSTLHFFLFTFFQIQFFPYFFFKFCFCFPV